jgi:hypothetical protein
MPMIGVGAVCALRCRGNIAAAIAAMHFRRVNLFAIRSFDLGALADVSLDLQRCRSLFYRARQLKKKRREVVASRRFPPPEEL